jgi:hypothetical protein
LTFFNFFMTHSRRGRFQDSRGSGDEEDRIAASLAMANGKWQSSIGYGEAGFAAPSGGFASGFDASGFDASGLDEGSEPGVPSGLSDFGAAGSGFAGSSAFGSGTAAGSALAGGVVDGEAESAGGCPAPG